MIRQIPINGFDSNFSYFVSDRGKVAVVDPGDVDHLIYEIEEGGFEVSAIWLTHSHFDHTSGVREMVNRFAVPVYMHKNARGRVEIEDEMTVFLQDGDKLKVGGLRFNVLWTPGHIDDAVCFYREPGEGEPGALISGDTLFVEGCGRADLANSDVEDLWRSLCRLKALPDSVKVYPGHDYGSKHVSDIAWEKAHNKFLKCKSLEEFRKIRLPSVWN